ncbi:MAG: hypothetical protein M9894_15610 [Planctomycetes bacterium]|nr:hypothetical protein [Planctomycetota bacterium]
MELTDWTFRLAGPDDAPALLDLVRRAYVGSYPELRGGEAALADAIERREAAYALALDPSGEHAGQVALERRGVALWEHGRAVVHPRWRGLGLLARMSQVLFEAWAPARGVDFVVGRSVTNHVRTQRYNEAAGFVPLGLLLGVWAPTLRVLGLPQAVQPISALLVGKALGSSLSPRPLALEGADRERARAVLDALGAPTRRARPRRRAALSAVRRVEQGGRLVHVQLAAAAGPTHTVDRDLLRREVDQGARVVWVDVPAAHARAAAALAGLRDQGLTWAAYLPNGGAAGEDVVRLQAYLDTPLAASEVQVVERARPLRDLVLAEAARVMEVAA